MGLRAIILLTCTVLTLPVPAVLAFTNVPPLISTIWLGLTYSFVAVSLDSFQCINELTMKTCWAMSVCPPVRPPVFHPLSVSGNRFSREAQTLFSGATSTGSSKRIPGCSYICPGLASWMDIPGRHFDQIPRPHQWWLYVELLNDLCT